MENLWKKETGRADYVDLFASIVFSPADMYIRMYKIQQTRKCNSVSTEWRSKGNDFFRQEDWDEAKKCYNKSLCFAEVGSENEALAYSNRSACFFKLMMFKEALNDIELAISANLPKRLIPKLEQRKEESLKLLPKALWQSPPERSLSYEADKNFPCMANEVEMKYNQEFGRHLIAKCDIPVGRTVLIEKDIPQVRDDEVCHTCLRMYTNCVACPCCPDVEFCSVDCKNSNQIHEFECGSIFPRLSISPRLHVKILLMAITAFPDVDGLMHFVEDTLLEDPKKLPLSLNDPKSKYHFFFKLSTSTPRDSALLEVACMVYKFAMAIPKISALFNSRRKKRFLMHLSMHHILVSNGNWYGGEQRIDRYVATVSCLLSHSCAPNIIEARCAYSSNVLRVTGRPIRIGEQLFVSYIDYSDIPTKERKARIKSEYGFDCKCEKCGPKRATLDRKLITSDPCYKFILKNRDDTTISAQIQQKCIDFLNKYGRSWSSEVEMVLKIYRWQLALLKLV